jgi:hypothetical protein
MFTSGGFVRQDADASFGEDASPDSEERIREFLARHGGPSPRPSRGETTQPGVSGWSEVYAADGYRLRCDWSRMGSREEMKFSEISPTHDANS